MREISLFPGEGRFYKVNLHCHTTCSDGRRTASEIKDAYKARGYSAVAYSDHNTLTPHNELEDEDFIPINAVEIDFNRPSETHKKGWMGVSVCHLNFFSKDRYRTEFIPFDRTYGLKEIQKLIDDANKAGFLVQYNHPRWSFQSAGDFIPLKGLFGFEVFNTGCEVDMANGFGDYEYEMYCRSGGVACPVATDDNHNAANDFDSPYDDSFGGWTMIKAERLSYDSLIAAMENKNCFASTGAGFIGGSFFKNGKGNIVVKGECEPCSSVFILTETRASDKRRSLRDDITSFEFELPGDTDWFRLELRDSKGGRAYTGNYLPTELDREG